MLAAMTSREISEWQAFYILDNEVEPEDEVAALGLSEQASQKLRERRK